MTPNVRFYVGNIIALGDEVVVCSCNLRLYLRLCAKSGRLIIRRTVFLRFGLSVE